MSRSRFNIVVIIMSVFIVGLIVSVVVVNSKISKETEKNLYHDNIVAMEKKIDIQKTVSNRIEDGMEDMDFSENNSATKAKEKQKIFYEIPVDEPVLIQ